MYLIDLLGRTPTTNNKDWSLVSKWDIKFNSFTTVIYFKIKISVYLDYRFKEQALLSATCYTKTGQVIKYSYKGELRTKKELENYCKAHYLFYELINDSSLATFKVKKSYEDKKILWATATQPLK